MCRLLSFLPRVEFYRHIWLFFSAKVVFSSLWIPGQMPFRVLNHVNCRLNFKTSVRKWFLRKCISVTYTRRMARRDSQLARTT